MVPFCVTLWSMLSSIQRFRMYSGPRIAGGQFVIVVYDRVRRVLFASNVVNLWLHFEVVEVGTGKDDSISSYIYVYICSR